MAKVYVGQTALQIRLNLNQNITDAYNRIIIKYKKPNGVRGFWPAEVLDPTNGIIAFTIDPDKGGFTDVGYWTVWAHIYFKDGAEIAGERVQIGVYQQGKTYVAFPYGSLSHIGEGVIMAQEAFEIIYNNSTSGLVSTNVQDAIDEVKTDIDNIAVPTATQVTYSNTVSHLPATNVQSAVDSLAQSVNTNTTLVAATNGIVFVDPTRQDVYVPTGNILTPFKSIAAALAVVQTGQIIQLAPSVYIENVALPDGVSMQGTEETFVTITGQLTTGQYSITLNNFVLNGNMNTGGPVTIANVEIIGNVLVTNDFNSSYITINPPIGVPLTVTGGDVHLSFAHITSNDSSSAIIQHGGELYMSRHGANSNSTTNATLYSDGGTVVVTDSTTISNLSGIAISINNDGTQSEPNVLSNVLVTGNIETGSAYTEIELIHFTAPFTISGTNIVLRPANFISYDTSNTQLPLPNIDPGAPVFNNTVQAAIDFIWSSCKSGTVNPTYIPIKAPELYVNTATNTLWIWTGAWHYVILT
jgi:hypothetical protein